MSSTQTFVYIGNAANIVVLGASIVYAAIVIYFTQPGKSGVLDEAWKKDGFCIHNKDVRYASSFDTCLYVDVLLSLLLYAMYWKWKNLPGMETASEIVPMLILGTLGHGLAHGIMAAKFRDGSYETEKMEEAVDFPPWPQLLAFCALFWFPLLKASMPKMNSAIVAFLAVIVTYGPTFAGGMKKQLGFAYIQTVLSIAFHLSQLTLKAEEKQRREYMTLPLSAIFPVLVAFNEAMFCSSYFRALGGHVIYDFSIIFSYIVFYVDCYRVTAISSSSPTKITNKEKLT
jgi:hypothetical protein